jgi:hypothetical protein
LLAANAGTNWPAPTAQTLYVFYLPPNSSLSAFGLDFCPTGGGGYHSAAPVGANGSYVAYGVISQCPTLVSADNGTGTASHEINEATTDPGTSAQLGYVGFDADHLSYEFMNQFQDELGDACEFFASSIYQDTEPGFPYLIQSQWSNESAAAGHDPCVPAATGPYFDVTLLPGQEDTITADLSSLGSIANPSIARPGVQTKGIKAALGQTRAFQIGLYSDGPTSGPWTITTSVDPAMPFADSTGNTPANGAATVTLSRASGQNGDTATVTVTPTSFSTYGVIYMYITSSLGSASHVLPILVAGQ